MAIADTVPAPELSATGLRLRPWQAHDAAALSDAVLESLVTVGRWLPWCHTGYSAEDAQAWIAHCRHGWSCGEHFAFAIADDRGELLGGIGLNQRDRTHRSANLGYWVRQSRQGEGIAACAAALTANFGFEQLGLIRIEIVTLPGNHASRRTAEKVGATLDTVARRQLWMGGQAMDAVVYGLVLDDVVHMPMASTTPASP